MGIWKDRTDIGDSTEFVREMRRFVADRATDILIDEGYSFAVKLEHTLETA